MVYCLENISVRVPEIFTDDGRWIPQLHDVGWILSFVFTITASCLAFWLLWMHATYYHKPWEQRHIARIVLMLPVYSIISFLSYLYYPWAMVYNTVSSAYEAFALFSFFLLLRSYLDPGTQDLRHDLEHRKITYWAWPLSYRILKKRLHLHNMNGLTWYWIICFGISQYAVLRPLLAIASIILQHFHLYCGSTLSPLFGNFYIIILQSISVATAMYCLLAFYLELKEEPALKRNRPFFKLICIKLVILLIFWQSIALSLLTIARVIQDQDQYWSARDIGTGLNAFVTCAEMAFLSVLHIFAFSYKEYVPEDKCRTTARWDLIVDAFNPKDLSVEFWRSSKWVFRSGSRIAQDLVNYGDDSLMDQPKPPNSIVEPKVIKSEPSIVAQSRSYDIKAVENTDEREELNESSRLATREEGSEVKSRQTYSETPTVEARVLQTRSRLDVIPTETKLE